MRITKALFLLSDLCAWSLLVLALICALAQATGGPLLAAMAHEPVSIPKSLFTIFIFLGVAIGAFLLTRRRPLALLLVLIPTVIALVNGATSVALAYLGLVLIVFGLPFLLVLLESRARASGSGT